MIRRRFKSFLCKGRSDFNLSDDYVFPLPTEAFAYVASSVVIAIVFCSGFLSLGMALLGDDSSLTCWGTRSLATAGCLAGLSVTGSTFRYRDVRLFSAIAASVLCAGSALLTVIGR